MTQQAKKAAAYIQQKAPNMLYCLNFLNILM